MIVVVDGYVETRETYHFMELVAALVDTSIFGGENASFVFASVNTLRDVTSHFGQLCLLDVWIDLLSNE